MGRYIARARAVLIFCSDGYFISRNCMVELRVAVKVGKLIIPLVDFDTSRGGLTLDQVHDQLMQAESSSFKKWKFDEDGPSANELYNALVTTAPIEWNRIGAFQDV